MSWFDFMVRLLGGGESKAPAPIRPATARPVPAAAPPAPQPVSTSRPTPAPTSRPAAAPAAPQPVSTSRPAPAPAPALTPQQQDPLFWGQRSEVSKKIIREQVYSVAEHIFKDGVQFDEKDAHWFVVPDYKLPPAWRGIASSTSMMIVFPTLYPEIPPIGFYLKNDLPRAPGGHFYTAAYHDAAKAPLQQGWKWYCVYVNPGSWQPSAYRGPGSWQRGDNLYTYLTLIKEALSSSDG